MKTKKALIIFISAATLILCTACKNLKQISLHKKNAVSIVSYNAQTFFDAVENGNEFKEFRGKNSTWNKEKYEVRLKRLLEAVILTAESLGHAENTCPDILLLQEIESSSVLEDFCKILPVTETYKEAVFIPPEKGAAFGMALLSKFPVKNVKAHNLHNENSKLRPIVETLISVNIGGSEYETAIFNVHWKSKAGAGNSSFIRKKQEKLLFGKIKEFQTANPDGFFAACGDFNQTPEEFYLMKKFKNCWNSKQHKEKLKKGIHVQGSYFFKNEWEAIDHFFYSDNLSDGKGLDIDSFTVAAKPPLIKKDGSPNRFFVFNGKGYSDHLPIGISLKVN